RPALLLFEAPDRLLAHLSVLDPLTGAVLERRSGAAAQFDATTGALQRPHDLFADLARLGAGAGQAVRPDQQMVAQNVGPPDRESVAVALIDPRSQQVERVLVGRLGAPDTLPRLAWRSDGAWLAGRFSGLKPGRLTGFGGVRRRAAVFLWPLEGGRPLALRQIDTLRHFAWSGDNLALSFVDGDSTRIALVAPRPR
ncbi:hypothetical protein, partial [Teichococcus deserti]|uniref:hypothetical protein n=1 Tax=Teichococcus deserti TaxID=1817963 RepID=UPI0013F637ED